MVSTASYPKTTRCRVASQSGCKRPRSRCRSTKNHERSLHRNQQYSIIAITNGGGSITEHYAYSAYGTLTITEASGSTRTTTAIGNRYTYTGREYDESLNLYHYRARMYDPVSGRFCSGDPIGYEGGINIYVYASNAPLTMFDYSGLAPCNSTISFTAEPASSPQNVSTSNKDLTIFPGYRAKAYTAICFGSDCECSSCDRTPGCCDPNKMTCDVKIRFHIYMDREQIGIERRDPDRIYGHEQAHVKVYVDKFKEYVRRVQANKMNGFGCLNGEDCRWKESEYEKFILNMFKSIRSIGHNTNRGGPKVDSDVDPIGKVPKDGQDPGGCFQSDWEETKARNI